MKLVASMPVRDEFGRYLKQTIEHALTYCDEVYVLDNGSGDGGAEWLEAKERVVVRRFAGLGWAEDGGHEGAVRQALFEHVLTSGATHVLAIDADEIVPQGATLRGMLESEGQREVWGLRVVEAWCQDPWQIRVDGGWRPRFAPVVYRLPAQPGADWRMRSDLRLACPRQPVAVTTAYMRRPRRHQIAIDLVHLGWSNPVEREARAARYFDHDGGRFHASEHLQSILWTDERVRLEPYPSLHLDSAL